MTSPLSLSFLPLFPLGSVLFPEGLLALRVFEVRYLDMVHKCQASDTPFGVVLLTHGREVRVPEGHEEFALAGTLASIVDTNQSTPGLMQVMCRGAGRFKVVRSERRPNGLWMAELDMVASDLSVPVPDELQPTADALGRALESLDSIPEDRWPVVPPFQLDDCGWVANRWCDLLPLPLAQKQQLLMLDNPVIRLELLQDVLEEHGLLGA